VIELTDTIKQFVLDNRVYHVPKPKETPSQTINQYLNVSQNMYNFVSNMDTIKKITSCVDYNNGELMSISQLIEDKYAVQREQLENNKGHHELDMDDFLETIDDITKGSKPEEMNVMYDFNTNKLLVYDSCEWHNMLIRSGIKSIVNNIREYYWNAYECYLIRRITKSNEFRRAELMELLKKYFAFLLCFEMKPYLHERTDNEVLYNADDDRFWNQPRIPSSFGLEEEYMKVFSKVRTETKNLTKMQNEVISLIKNNTRACLKDLNTTIMDIISVDEEFKRKMFPLRIEQSV